MTWSALAAWVRVAAVPAAAVLLAAACGDDASPPRPDADPGAVRAIYEPAAGAMPFGDVPWPDDLYLDEEGHPALGRLPGEERSDAPGYHEAMRLALGELDGFGAVSTIFFFFDGPIDPASLPRSSSRSLRDGAAVFLMDIDPASPVAFTRIPVKVHWDGETRQLALRPEDGHPLAEGRAYAAIVTDSVLSAGGIPVRPGAAFAQVRDALSRPPHGPLAAAYDEYTPVLEVLSGAAVARERVVALAVFHVQTVTADLVDARRRVWEGDAPAVTVRQVVPSGDALDARLGRPAEDVPGLDVSGGVAHTAVGWMVHGTFQSPWMISEAPDVHGRFSRDAAGELVVRFRDEVPFTLFLPTMADLSSLPTVIVQHGIGDERSVSVVVADAFAAAGYALLAIDAPFHGLRNAAPNVDSRNRFTGVETPDQFGDVEPARQIADFFGAHDDAGELVALSPVYMRDAMRQSVVDLLTLTRLIREGDWTALGEAQPELGAVSFSDAPLAFVELSNGGSIGAMYAAVEPEVGAALLVSSGGGLLRTILESPPLDLAFLPELGPKVGLRTACIDYEGYPLIFRPELAVWETLLARGDPIGYGALLRTRPLDLLMTMARDDEVLPNVATEALARTVGAEMIGGTPAYADLVTADAPLRGNVSLDERMLTRALFVYDPATHGLMTLRHDTRRYARPVTPPFEAAGPTPVDNPVGRAIAQMMHFFQSWRGGSAEVVDPAR